jgi:hypothetical protein
MRSLEFKIIKNSVCLCKFFFSYLIYDGTANGKGNCLSLGNFYLKFSNVFDKLCLLFVDSGLCFVELSKFGLIISSSLFLGCDISKFLLGVLVSLDSDH